MRTRTWLGVAALAASAALFAWSLARAAHDGRLARAWPERLLGPIANVAASLQWVRVDDAWNHGRPGLADRRARFALSLAPDDPAGWLYYGRHLVYDRGSATGEAPREERMRWVRAGIDVLERGERECAHPGPIAFGLAVVYLSMTQYEDGERPCPLTRAEAWRAAAEAFDRAAAAGEPLAREAAAAARERAAADER